jgi:hypothetical protein
MPYLAGTTSSPTWSPLVEPRLLLSSTAAPTAARDAHQSRVAWHAPHPLLPSVRGCEWGSNPLGGSLYSLLNKPIQRWTGARAGEVSEAAAVKARWLGNFCPRQPVHRALKRQRSSRDRRLRSGRARWKPQSIRTRIAVTAFIPGCSLTALRALGETE